MDKIRESVDNQEVQSLAWHCATTTLAFPLELSRTLIQLGYEPFPPTQTTYFRSTYLALPNQLSYLRYIKSVDGFFGCYRGLLPRVCQSIIAQTVYKRIALRNPYFDENPDSSKRESGRDNLKLSKIRSGALIRGSQIAEDVMSMARHTGWEILSVAAGTFASHPFYVITVRSMGQFVGRETKYSNILDAIKIIYSEEGLLGFYQGLIPRLISDAVFISLSASLVYLFASYFGRRSPVESLTVMASNTISSTMVYQLQVVSSVMAVNGAGLEISGYPFTRKFDGGFTWGWYECWNSLAKDKQLKRGSALIGRHYTGPTVIVNGAKRPTGFYFGPRHPAGLGYKEKTSIFFPHVKTKAKVD